MSFSSGWMRLGSRVRMSAARRLMKSAPERSMARRMSPSVTMPSMRSPSQTTISPSPQRLIVWIISLAVQSGPTTGRLSLRMTSPTVASSRRPRLPPGWSRAKSLLEKLRIFIRATAIASPMAICAVVEVVGARCRMQASWSTETSRWMSEWMASVEAGLPVIEISRLPLLWMKGTILSTSSVSPE